VWITGNIAHFAVICGLLALLSGAIATVSYTPYASALIVDLSPPSLRGVYFALNSQCWAIGYLIGPPLGGWVLDTSATYAHNFWLIAAASISVGIVILWYLEKVIKSSEV
jgi:MFS family permease